MNGSLVKLQAMMFLMMLIGIILQKRKIITISGMKMKQ